MSTLSEPVKSELMAPPDAERRTLLPSANAIERMMMIANAVAKSGMPLPKNCRTAESVFAKIVIGYEHGLGPMTSLHEIHLIEGKASLPSAIKVGVIRERGLGTLDLIECTNAKARVKVHRNDWHPDRYEIVEYTIEDATAAGLTKNDTYRKHPRSMLSARAHDLAVHLYMQEAFMGLPYSPGELGVEEDENGRPVSVAFVELPAPTFLKAPEPAPVSDAPAASSPSPLAIAIEQLSADPIKQALTEVFTGPTPETMARAKAVYQALELDAITWGVLIAREHVGAKSLKNVLRDKAAAMVARLEKIAKLRLLKQASNLSDESWASALRKRAVSQDVLLKSEDVDAIYAKLYEQVSPFERQKLGIDPTPEGSTAGKPLPPQSQAA